MTEDTLLVLCKELIPLVLGSASQWLLVVVVSGDVHMVVVLLAVALYVFSKVKHGERVNSKVQLYLILEYQCSVGAI